MAKDMILLGAVAAQSATMIEIRCALLLGGRDKPVPVKRARKGSQRSIAKLHALAVCRFARNGCLVSALA